MFKKHCCECSVRHVRLMKTADFTRAYVLKQTDVAQGETESVYIIHVYYLVYSVQTYINIAYITYHFHTSLHRGSVIRLFSAQGIYRYQ